MKVIKTVATDLHLRVQKSMRKTSPERQYQRSREQFLKRVHQTLGWNYVKEGK